MSEPGPEAASAARGPPAPAGQMPATRPRAFAYRWFWLIAAAVFAADQGTKLWIAGRIPFRTTSADPGAVVVIPNFLYFIHVGNTGAAWSLFPGQSALLGALAAATLAAIFFWRHALGLRVRAVQACFGLLCGGILGNLCDRLLHGHVVDFIDVHLGAYNYPTFNVADSGICVGVIAYLIKSLRSGDH
jgi:signal peptidase II